jgi:hypothetical protein
MMDDVYPELDHHPPENAPETPRFHKDNLPSGRFNADSPTATVISPVVHPEVIFQLLSSYNQVHTISLT